MYKISTLTRKAYPFSAGQTFVAASDICDKLGNLITFKDIRDTEQFASNYAKARGFKYLEIGDLSEPTIGETFVEIRTA